MHDTRHGRSSELNHGRRPWWLNLVGENYEDDWQDSHRVGSRIFRICFHRDTRIGRPSSHHSAWPPLLVLLSRGHGLQFHKLWGVRGDGIRPKCRMLWQYPCRRRRSLGHASCSAKTTLLTEMGYPSTQRPTAGITRRLRRRMVLASVLLRHHKLSPPSRCLNNGVSTT